MNEKIKEFINARIAEENQKYEAEKKRTLLELGLYEKIYSPDNKYSDEFDESELDGPNTYKYFKKEPFEISDEDYHELKKHIVKEKTKKSTFLPLILKCIAGLIFIVGFSAGISFGNVVVDPYDVIDGIQFSFAIALTYWSVSLISGTLILAVAEIIKLLEDIKNK